MKACDEPTRLRLENLYAAALLDRPPIRAVAEGMANREDQAHHYAHRDVGRLLRAVGDAGFELTLRRGQASLFAEAELLDADDELMDEDLAAEVMDDAA